MEGELCSPSICLVLLSATPAMGTHTRTAYNSCIDIHNLGSFSNRFSQASTILKGAALITNIFIFAATRLLRVIRSDGALHHATAFQLNLLNFTSYAAIVLNTVATAASVFLIYLLDHSDVPITDNAQLESTTHLLQQLTLQSQYFISESPNLTFLCDRHNTCSHRVDIYILTATRIHLGTRRVGDGHLVHRIHRFSHLRSLSPSWVS
ncbi:hypothetical protein B0H13DRAFT_2088824 [Mycena leptocephala]|nr:hypothetical protein B0H13DRAFT_2088824 [Mycena leptocephala]